MTKEKIRFKDLSFTLKVVVVYGLGSFTFLCIWIAANIFEIILS